MSNRNHKGTSVLHFQENYIVLDIESTGFDYFYEDIIEVCAKKYINMEFHSEIKSLIKPTKPISPFISKLTGIDDSLVSNAPNLIDFLPKFHDFIEDYLLVAHNANFDINFLYDASLDLLNKPITNNFLDTLRLSRALVKDTKNNKLQTLATHFNLDSPNHRAEQDVDVTNELYKILYERSKENPIQNKRSYHDSFDFRSITTTLDADPTNYFYQQTLCFTGKMTSISKKEAAQMAANLGSTIQNSVNNETSILVLGDLEYQQKHFGDKSSKHKKAESLQSAGSDIEIITEMTFLELINQ